MNMQEHSHNQHRTGWFQSRTTTWVLLGILAMGVFFLIKDYPAQLLSVLPFALFLLCPLMMLFIHHGHGGHTDHDQPGEHEEQSPEGGQR
jgi:Protein of unknown function (DUF2933).